MRVSYSATIGSPHLSVRDDASGLTLDIKPPREVLLTMTRENARWLYHNGTKEEFAQLRALAAEILS